jgi:lipoprotein-anchoring transpeptidase ErfK/SrfK
MRSGWVTIALVAALAWGTPTAAAARPGKKRRVAARTVSPPAARFDPRAVGSSTQPDTRPGDRGSPVLRAQILLARAHFSCGEIDGDFGTNLQKVVSAYQAENHLPVTATVDAGTWALLNRDGAPPLMDYTITPEDEAGPFLPVPGDMMQQATLPQLGYASPLEELSERFHASPAVLAALNPGADFGQPGQSLTVPNVLTLPPGQAAKVVVGKAESSVRAYDAAGKLIAFYMATSGSEHDPLPIGDWKIPGVQKNPEFHYNASLFWDAKDPDARAVIKPGPNNPVGLVWIDLSKEHYGIHGTPEPSKIGHATSHGCVRLTNWDALELASMVKPGTPALLRE